MRAVRSSQKHHVLLQADLALEKVRLYVRLAHRRKRFSHDQYHSAAKYLVEIGRLLGGWLKSLPQGE